MLNQAWHLVFVFIAIGVAFNLIRNPTSWQKFLSGTFGSLLDVSKGIAAIPGAG